MLEQQNCSFGGVEIMSKAGFLLIKKELVKLKCNKTLRPAGWKDSRTNTLLSLLLKYVKANLTVVPQDTDDPTVSIFKESELFVPTQLRAIQTACAAAWNNLPMRLTLFTSSFMWNWSTYATFTVCQVGKAQSVKYWSKMLFFLIH